MDKLNVHFRTVWSSEVMIMSEDDFTEDSFAAHGMTEFWFEPADQDLEAKANI